MTRRLLLTYLTITAFVLLVLEVSLGIVFARQELDRLTGGLERDAMVLATMVEDSLERGVSDRIPEVAAGYAARTGARVVVTDAAGRSVADTETGGGRDFATRPEIDAALSGDRSAGVRYSETLDTNLLYVAVPVASGGQVFGAVRLTYPTSEVDSRVLQNWLRLGLLAAVVLAASAVVGTLLARSVTRPLRRLEETADALAGGDLTARATDAGGPPEVRHLAAAFDGMAERLEELVASQRRFTANVSHDLRTPLTALRLRLENVEEEAEPSVRADVEAALAEVARLDGLVERLLAFARAERERPPTVTVDLAAAARERHGTWSPLAAERSVVLVCEAGRRVVATTVQGAPEQILDNLIANALEVAPEGSTVTIRAAPAGTWAELHVIDRGPGLSEQDRELAFERFWRGTSEHVTDGTGLGLAIVRQLARASGGDARLDPGPDGGVDAYVRLPAAP